MVRVWRRWPVYAGTAIAGAIGLGLLVMKGGGTKERVATPPSVPAALVTPPPARTALRALTPASPKSAPSPISHVNADAPHPNREKRAAGTPNFKVQLISKPSHENYYVDTNGVLRKDIPTYSEAYLEITLVDAQPTVVERVVLNGRTGKSGCDLRGTNALSEVPRTLELGDSVKVPWSAFGLGSLCGESLVRIDIYTDRGESSYQIK